MIKYENNYCFYQFSFFQNFSLNFDTHKFGISKILDKSKGNFIRRANDYQALISNYVIFLNVLVIDKYYYLKGRIEQIFDRFIKEKKLGKRLNHLRKGCEKYILQAENVMIRFYDFLKNKGVKCQLLSPEEVDTLNENYKKNNHKYIKKNKDIFEEEKEDSFNLDNFFKNGELIPYPYQKEVLKLMKEYYITNNIGQIIWACGLGKALLSLFFVKNQGYRTICIGVPSLYLRGQFRKEILKLFPCEKNLLLIGGEGGTTNPHEIKKFMRRRRTYKFVITTYDSCWLLKNYKFDFKIGDEAHHLVCPEKPENKKTYDKFHKIKSIKTMFMTATRKIIENKDNVYSMDDKKKFGSIIDDTKNVKWAIEHKYIVDYNILVLNDITENELNLIMKSLKLKLNEKYQELFLSAYMTLKSMEKYSNITHTLIYVNKKEHAKKVKEYIKIILDSNLINIDKNQLYNNDIHSDNCANKDNEIKKFKNSKFGIISCVYMLGEGFDLPELTSVCIAENMKSYIRIVQYILRPNRLNKNKLDKIASIIFPYIDRDDWDTNDSSFSKLRNTISKIRLEDDNVEDKIKVPKFNKYNKKYNKNSNKEEKYHYDELDDNNEELNKIKIKLIKSRELGRKKLKNFIDELKIYKITNQKLYFEKQEEYNLPINPHFMYSEFSWSLLQVNNNYYTKEECIEKINEIYEIYENKIEEIDDNDVKREFYHNKNNKIPNKVLWTWYGNCKKSDFKGFD